MSAFPDHTLNPVQVDSLQVNALLASFTPAFVDEVRNIIMSSPNKLRDLNSYPTTLLKACLDILLYPITNIANPSLCSGLFSDDFKQVQVNPPLKSTLPDENSYRRPISITSNCMSNVLQSAYKQFHSTETALLKVHNVTLNMDKGKVTVLTLLDLSAALDSTDHDILTKRLSIWYGISGTAPSWFSSYLTDRYQRVKIANCFSTALPTSCDVPRGYVLGQLLFTLYTTPLSSVIQTHNLDHHLYAEDTHTQIYLSLVTPDTNCSLNQLRDCLHDIFYWMTDSKLKLNANKTVSYCWYTKAAW